MDVPGGRLELGVAELLADHRQPLAGCDGGRGASVPKVVDPDVLEASRGLKVGEASAGERADPGGVDLLDGRQDVDRWLTEMDDLGASLGIRQAQSAAGQIDMFSLERHDLAEPAAGQDRQSGGSDG
ncbi:MAG: hypothetical protein U1E60_15850 [Reyranellaceae bacterium]